MMEVGVFCLLYTPLGQAHRHKRWQIFLQILSEVKNTRADLEDDEEMATPSQVVNMFVDFTDPTPLISALYVWFFLLLFVCEVRWLALVF
jgi:hypothetical protein